MRDGLNELRRALRECVRTARWTCDGRSIDSSALMNLYNRRRTGTNAHLNFMRYKPQLAESTINHLARLLRAMFSRYVNADTDRIGNGMFSFTGGSPKMLAPTIPRFARTVIKPAVVLGSKHMADLLDGWASGGPLRLSEYALLEGVSIEKNITLPEGIRVRLLPQSIQELPTSLPVFPEMPHVAYLGGVVMCIDCNVSPAVYKPQDREPGVDPVWPEPEFVYGSGRIPNLDHNGLCEALSLACDHHICWTLKWIDEEEMQLFANFLHSSATFTPQRIGWSPQVALSQEDLQEALRIHVQRHVGARRGLDVAIKRWIGSKKQQSLENKFIDLRIALESLYLKSGFGELSFRLSTHCAWHLGTDGDTRKKIFKAVQDLYKLASKAVHGGRIKDTPKYRDVLQSAQGICRDGILRRLQERTEPDWNELILG